MKNSEIRDLRQGLLDNKLNAIVRVNESISVVLEEIGY